MSSLLVQNEEKFYEIYFKIEEDSAEVVFYTDDFEEEKFKLELEVEYYLEIDERPVSYNNRTETINYEEEALGWEIISIDSDEHPELAKQLFETHEGHFINYEDA
jgi:hypothetical protein